MYGLALCSGLGGLELGVRIATRGHFRVVCHVEREAYAAATLVARMEDEALDRAPVWDDLTTFDGSPWRGLVDCVTAGIPCQPYSLAGARARHDDERALWPELVRVVEECEPAFVFLENVPEFLKYFEPVWSCLSGLGFQFAPPLLQTAADRGAPHLRKRVFILAANPDRARLRNESGRSGRQGRRGSTVARDPYDVAPDASGAGLQIGPRRSLGPGDLRLERQAAAARDHQPADSDRRGLQSEWSGWVFNAERQTLRHDTDRCGDGCRICGSHWETESPPVRMDDGFPGRVDELRATGNSVIPDMAAEAWTYLFERLLA